MLRREFDSMIILRDAEVDQRLRADAVLAQIGDRLASSALALALEHDAAEHGRLVIADQHDDAAAGLADQPQRGFQLADAVARLAAEELAAVGVAERIGERIGLMHAHQHRLVAAKCRP